MRAIASSPPLPFVLLFLAVVLPFHAACSREADPSVLLDADRAFASAVAAHDEAAFRALVHEEAKFFGSTLLQGPDAVTAAWGPIIRGEIGIEWAPDEAHIAASGDLGYTIGTARYRMTAADGSPELRQGRYVTIWRRRPDGSWGAVVDIGTGPQTVVEQARARRAGSAPTRASAP